MLPTFSTEPPRAGVRRAVWAWAALAAAAALVPFAQGLSGSRVFYVRDLSLYFWGRYLWLRRAWLSGEWPLWDPYVGGGQAAYSDPLHQMFLPPAVAVRLIGGEVLGFNLWVALPFPMAALGAFLLLARHFTAPASALGALAFALCGPILSSGNFPNLSWSVAAIPWMVWAADRVVTAPAMRRVAGLAIVTALMCLAGEPVTVFTTVALVLAYALVFSGGVRPHPGTARLRAAAFVLAGLALGAALAAVQMIPMVQASLQADRAGMIRPDTWSLRPTALLETVWLHLFGNYYETQALSEAPWMQLMYTAREPFFFSIYFGVPLLALAAYGLGGPGPRRVRLFWLTAGLVALIAAFGSYTPIYPILRDHVPPFGSFRFPVKYIVVGALAVAIGAAAGWDALARHRIGDTPPDAGQQRRRARARLIGTAFAVVTGSLAAALAAACVFAAPQLSPSLAAFARALGAPEGTEAAAFIVRTVPASALSVIVPAFAAAGLLWVASGTRRWGAPARAGLYVLIAGDLLVKAAGINPAFDPVHYAEPAWLAYTRVDPHARVHVGGKMEGTLAMLDLDAPRGYLNTPGLTGSASRAALSIQAAFYPSAWRVREMLSYDLPVLWPKAFAGVSERFAACDGEARDRFLDRTGVRYRILPAWRAEGRPVLTAIQQFNEAFLFDWGEQAAPRAAMVPYVRVVPDVETQIAGLFEDGWDSRALALVEREAPVAGRPGPAVMPFARFIEDRSNRAVLEAGAGPGGGYLIVLDSYSDDWRVTVDGVEAVMVRANGLFRAVHLAAGSHTIEFDYRPPALLWGGGISLAALTGVIGLLLLSGSRSPARIDSQPGAPVRPGSAALAKSAEGAPAIEPHAGSPR